MRDYEKNPLDRFEPLDKNDIYELLIVQNLHGKEVCKIFGCSHNKLTKYCKLYDIKKTKEQKLGVRKRTNLQKYGVENPIQLEEFKLIREQTCITRFGVDNVNKLPEKRLKAKQTCLKKYGVENPNQSSEIQRKRREKCLRETGYECITQTPEHKQKIKESVKRKYGVDNISRLSEIQQKKMETLNKNYPTKEAKLQITQRKQKTCLEKYGAKTFAESTYCNWDEIQQKRDETLTKNQTHNKSKSEDLIFQQLQTKFPDVLRSYKSDKYTYRCDFYIPSLDLYIEYQEHPSHGEHEFNVLFNEDLLKFNQWLQRSQEFNFKGNKKNSYKGYLKTWVIRDRKKRQLAKKNNLNWIEFFNMKDFNEWFEQQGASFDEIEF